MRFNSSRLFALLLLCTGALSACAPPCQESLGVYPPGHIVVTGAERVEVPHIAWTCEGFHSDSMEPPPAVPPGADRVLLVETELEEGSTVDIRFGNDPVQLGEAPVQGPNTWRLSAPDPAQPLVVRICSEDRRCAMYWANTYAVD